MTQETTQKRQHPLVIGLILTTAVVLLAAAGGSGLRTYQAWQVLDQVTLSPPVDSNGAALEKALAEDRARADALKTKNLIAPPPPETNPVREVAGILGDEALINGKWYHVGDKVGDAEIVAIETTHVKVVWKGQESVLAPISSSAAAAGGGGSAGTTRPGRPGRPSPNERGRRVIRQGGPPPGSIAERFRNMSPEERKAFSEKMRAMSPEERRAFMEKMRGQ